MPMILELLRARSLEPRKMAGTHGGEYACPCPGCGGRDRMRVWPEQGDGGTWYCRQEDKGGDCIEFLRHFDGLTFGEACKRLGLERRLERHRLTVPRMPGEERPFEPRERLAVPPAAWRDHAARLVSHAHAVLMADNERLDELARRGITRDAAARYRLGWLPGERGKACYFRARQAWGLAPQLNDQGRPKRLWIPCGLVIPALGQQGEILRLRVRRPDAHREQSNNSAKYVVIPGSSMHPLLLRPGSRAFVVVESELDAIACASAAEDAGMDVGAVAVGTNMGKPDVLAHRALSRALAIMVALDFDAPGKDGERPGAKGYAFWARAYRTARRTPVPRGKDPGEAVAHGVNLALWLRAALPPAFSVKSATPAPAAQAVPQAAPRSPQTALDDSRARLAMVCPEACAEPLAGLYTPIGPQDTLRVLSRAGLTVTRCVSSHGDDYRVTGHERWTDAAQARLTGWLHRWGQWVWDALYARDNDVEGML